MSWWWGPVQEVAAQDIASMARLLAEHFEGAERAVFHADLANKTHVVIVRGPAGQVQGFSTLALVPPVDGLPWTLYSGDTIVARDGRLGAALSRGWIDAALGLRETHRIDRLVWLLVCSSVRTFRFLPLFFNDFAPHPRKPVSPGVRGELERLAHARYGSQFDPTDGIVRLRRPQVIKAVHRSPLLVQDELERFYLARNPGAHMGDELVCHCEIHQDNLTAAGRRMLPQRWRFAP